MTKTPGNLCSKHITVWICAVALLSAIVATIKTLPLSCALLTSSSHLGCMVLICSTRDDIPSHVPDFIPMRPDDEYGQLLTAVFTLS